MIENPHATSVDDCIAAANSSRDGLTAAEATRRLATHGPERLPETRLLGPLLRFLAQFHNILVYVLIGTAAVTTALRHCIDTGVIRAVVLANALIGFLHEGKAGAAMSAIRRMLAPRAAVMRVIEAHGLAAQEAT